MRSTIPLSLLVCWAFSWLLTPTRCHADDSPSSKWEDAINKFEELDRQHPPPQGGILFVGSSSIRIWDVASSFPGLPVINRGFGGSEIADSVQFADRIVIPYHPRTIVFYAGDNDISRNKTPCRVYNDFREFVSIVHHSLPETRIVFIAIKPSLARWKLVYRMRAANALVRADCEEDPLLTYIDVEPTMLGDDGQPRPELFKPDGLHLNEDGYAIWNDLVRPYIESDNSENR